MFSFLDGISKPEEIIVAAKERGLQSIALTDHGTMHGFADFYLAAKKHSFKGIYGVEAYAIDDLDEWKLERERLKADKKALKSMRDEEDIDEDATNLNNRSKALHRKGHIVLLAQNSVGLKNLFNLVYLSHRDGFYSKPRVDKKMIAAHSEGLIASSACMGGVIANKCWQFSRGEIEWVEVVREAEKYKDIFGDRFFLELQFNESDSQRFINDCIIKVSKETGIRLDVTADAHYINSDDWEAQEILYMLRSKPVKTISTRGDDWQFNIKQLYIKSPEQMWEAYKRFGGDAPERLVREAFDNTLLIDSMIENITIDTKPRLPTLQHNDSFMALGSMTIDRLKDKGLDQDDRYVQRFLTEMKLIKSKGFANYFLVVKDMVHKARQKMMLGPSRGSAAGSLICYLNGITQIDPIKYDLMFERFLDPDRDDLPDIDLDFQDPTAAKDLLRETYGNDNVACVSNYSTFKIKSLLKDLGRVYDIDHNEINEFNKSIELELEEITKDHENFSGYIPYEDIITTAPSYVKLLYKYPILGKNIEKLYERNRHVGRHAAGVIIGDNLLNEMPIFVNDEVVQTPYTQGVVNKNCEAMGFVKFDLLGLATLNVIDHAIKLIAKREGTTYEQARGKIDPENLDVNDPVIFDTVFHKNNMMGIFQFSGEGIRSVTQRIHPTCFNDISAINAIYRPGPLGSDMDKIYAENKKNPHNIKYKHPLLEIILADTYGCLVYQEQTLKIGNLLGGLTLKDTNKLRKILVKKTKNNDTEIEKNRIRDAFIIGCCNNGMKRDDAQELWDMIHKFSGYGFNKSHSISYAMITMQTAYLRTYYPLEFFTALLTCGQSEEIQSYINEIKQQGFTVQGIDINESGIDYTITRDSIRLAFTAVKGVGAKQAEKIMALQPFSSFDDYLNRTGGNKAATLPLILVGAFSNFGENINTLKTKFEFWDATKSKTKKGREKYNTDTAEISLPELRLEDLSRLEMQYLGFNLNHDPFSINNRKTKINKLQKAGVLFTHKDFVTGISTMGLLCCLITSIQEKAQKNGQQMAFIKCVDFSGSEIEIICFGNIWRYISNLIYVGNVYMMTVNRKEDSNKIFLGAEGFKHGEKSCLQYVLNIDSLGK